MASQRHALSHVQTCAEGAKRHARHTPPIGGDGCDALAGVLGGGSQPRPDLSAWAEPEADDTAFRVLDGGVIPDRVGETGVETTVLGACLAYGLPYREVRRVFVWGKPPHIPRVGRPDEWGILWASCSDLQAILGPVEAQPSDLAANKASLGARAERLRKELGLDAA